MPNLEPHQMRVVTELADLELKASRLSAFIASNPIFLGLDPAERSDLRYQLHLQQELVTILKRRLRRMGIDPEAKT